MRVSGGYWSRVHWQSWLGPLLVVVLFSLLPVSQNYDGRVWFDTIGPFDFYAYLIQHNSVLAMLFPLVATLPYTLAFSGKLSHRFLTYTRTRASIRQTLGGHFLRNGVASFGVFLVVGMIPQLFVIWGSPHYDPAGYGFTTAEAVAAAQLHGKTFSQLLVYGDWAPVIGYSFWLALNASLYATLALSAVLLVPNRVLGLSLPWVGYLLTSFVMAVLWMESYSIQLAFPFNLTQLPLTNLAYPFIGLVVVTSAAVALALTRAPSSAQLQ